MKMRFRFRSLSLFLCLAVALLAAAFDRTAKAADGPGGPTPRILSVQVQAAEVVITVQVPAGLKRVTLEARTRFGIGAWVPRAVEHVDGQGGTYTFRLAKAAEIEMLRVRADEREGLPQSFYRGAAEFDGPQQPTDPGQTGGGWGPGLPVGMFPEDTAAPDAGGAPRDVVESDIWVIRGNTVYFFNQYRGLQIIDLQVPETPVVKGELAVPASGEQMYVIEDQYAVLLARNGCGWNLEDGSQILIVAAGDATPRVVGQVPLSGYIAESRLVGRVLYVATQTYRKIVLPPRPDGDGGGEQWEWGTQVTSIDLADPTQPAQRDTFWFPGYGHVISATDRFLFVAVQTPENWWQSQVQIVDIASPDGAMNLLSSLRPAGQVADKFKMNLAPDAVHGDVFTVISERRGNRDEQQASVLETFSLANPKAPQALGQLEVGHGEGLYATRFDGQRAYIVTFLRVDPLWVVDLSDPTDPRLFGELEVPGWSTYIHPLGDRLVSIGIDNTTSWKVAVSLFDVHDPSQPALLAKVPLGDQSSWSEANWDEKAFTVLASAGLILVPYQGWSDQGYASRVQLIELGEKTLTARGVIEHRMQPRRATVVGSHIVSVSGRELLVVKAADRDHPEVAAAKELSWGVNRVLLAGNHLLELTTGAVWGEVSPPTIRVVAPDHPNQVISQHTLTTAWPVIGAALKDGHLHLLQGTPTEFVAPVDPLDPPVPPTPNLRLTVFDLSDLPILKAVSTTDATVPSLGWMAQFKPFWLRPGLVVWASDQGSYPWLWRGWLDIGMMPPVAGWGGDALWWPWWGGSGSGRFLTFQLTDPDGPKLISDINLLEEQSWWNTSPAFAAGNLVYLSHQQGVFVPTSPGPGDPGDPGKGDDPRNPPSGYWEIRHYLDVVDFTDAANPTIRPPISIPGQLTGLAAGGALLYTMGPHYEPTGSTDGIDYLDAVAYDGVKAPLVTSLRLPSTWPRAVLVHEGVAFLARPDATTTEGWLETWIVPTDGPEAGQFVRQFQLKLDSPVDSLAAVGRLLAAPRGANLRLFDLTNPLAPKPAGSGALTFCGGWDLRYADGTPELGLWVPLQDYGVMHVPAER